MQIETAVFRLCGQSAAGPTGLVDQSNARIRAPISPPPLRKLNSGFSDVPSGCVVGVELMQRCTWGNPDQSWLLDAGGCRGGTLETVYIFLVNRVPKVFLIHLFAIPAGKVLLDSLMNLVGRAKQNQNIIDVDNRFRTGIDLGGALVNDCNHRDPRLGS